MTPLASLTSELTRLVGVGQPDIDRLRELKEGVPGWSELAHYITFRELLKAKPNARILVCGVYHGLDLRYLAGIAEDLGQKPTLVGVDLFSDGPCADWPVEKRGLPWMEAVGCPAPDMEAAKRNCPSAQIYKSDSVEFMQGSPFLFDVIVLDASHDEASVRAEIVAAQRILAHGGILLGDDYVWGMGDGVKKAVEALLPHHIVLFNRIWLSQAL